MEKILAENRTEPELAVTNDFVMTLLSQGQERTLSDYQKLFAKHGFVNVQFTHIDGLNYYDVMLLKKPFQVLETSLTTSIETSNSIRHFSADLLFVLFDMMVQG